MKFIITKVLILFIFISVAFAGAYLEYFHAYGENENIKLEWKTGQEDNIKSFVIVRKTPQTQYSNLTTIPAKGSYSFYTYIDESAYKANDLIFKYGLKTIDSNNQYSDVIMEVSATSPVNDVKQTWGMIKAMFR